MQYFSPQGAPVVTISFPLPSIALVIQTFGFRYGNDIDELYRYIGFKGNVSNKDIRIETDFFVSIPINSWLLMDIENKWYLRRES